MALAEKKGSNTMKSAQVTSFIQLGTQAIQTRLDLEYKQSKSYCGFSYSWRWRGQSEIQTTILHYFFRWLHNPAANQTLLQSFTSYNNNLYAN